MVDRAALYQDTNAVLEVSNLEVRILLINFRPNVHFMAGPFYRYFMRILTVAQQVMCVSV